MRQKLESEKTKRIEKINLNRDTQNQNNLSNNIVKNRRIAKIGPKYKILNQYENQGNYVKDTSNRRNTKYYKTQIRRRFKYQQVNLFSLFADEYSDNYRDVGGGICTTNGYLTNT